jgi:biopolymer transport protein ExbD
MKHRRRHKQRHAEVTELNITAFMNLMVVLVPFLLITAVFSRLAILELNLPTAQSQAEITEQPPELQLEITVRDDVIEVGDRNAGTLSRFVRGNDGQALEALASFLGDLKRRFPDKLDASLLLEPEISYDLLVQIMDVVRVAEVPGGAGRPSARRELFPEISIGDAPVD